jgi:hypothetical protein
MFIKSKTLQAMDLYGELFCADLLTSKVQDIRREYKKDEVSRKCFADIYGAEDKDEMREAISKAIAEPKV